MAGQASLDRSPWLPLSDTPRWRGEGLHRRPGDILVLLNADGRILQVSRAVRRALRYSPFALVGRKGLEFVHPHDQLHVLAAFQAALRCGKATPRVTARLLHRGGSWRWFEARFRRRREASGPVAICQLRDLAYLNQEELKVARLRSLLWSALDLSSVAFAVTTLEGGHILYANRAVEHIIGGSAASIIGRTALEMGWWPDAAARAAVMERLKAEGVVQNMEIQVPTRDGRWRWGLASFQLVKGAALFEGYQEPLVLACFVDNSEQKELEQALRESESKYRQLVEEINEVAFITDADGKIVYISPSVEQVGGYAVDELVGKHLSHFVHPDDLSLVEERRRKALSGVLEPVEYRVFTKMGEIRWVRSNSRPIYREGQLQGFQGVLSDITNLKRAEEELRQLLEERARLSQRLLRAHEEEQRRLAYELHDGLGQLIQMAQTYVGTVLARQRKGQRKAPQELEQAHRYLDLALKEMRAIFMGLRPFGLDEMGLEEALRHYLQSVGPAAGVTIVFCSNLGRERLPPHVESTVFRIAQEAVTNALKHANSGRIAVTLRVATLRPPGLPMGQRWVLLRVRDWGRGLPVRDLSEGLGLASMRDRAQMVNGTLVLCPQPGQGTVVSLRVPVDPL